MKKLAMAAAVGALVLAWGDASAAFFTTTLTSQGLGLGTDDINEDGTVEADIAGKFITSPTMGEGSKLFLLSNGLPGSAGLAMTITARTHLDVLSGIPNGGGDYLAGVLYLSNGPGVKDEGLGVRAFTVNKTTALRTFDTNGRAKIEGSKEVSGGTQDSVYDSGDPNGAPHVDESVRFTPEPNFKLDAGSLEFLLTKFEDGDRVDLKIKTRDGSVFQNTFLGLADASYLSVHGASGDKVKKLKSAGFAGIAGKELDWVEIRAVDDEPWDPRGTAEHFLINSMSANPVPEPSTIGVLAIGAIALLRRRK